MTDTGTHSRRVSPGWAAFVVAMVAQVITMGAAYGAMNQRVSALEIQTAPLGAGALVRVEERMVAMQASVARIERRLEQPQ
ncbi:MAG: hypothetical protein ACK4FB_09060 [Brevundimonas sp.]|uniref:hypothetical protein n=1 Tax=Brevundimonas sp. TaxID=1871086 RepID=UPI00391A5254